MGLASPAVAHCTSLVQQMTRETEHDALLSEIARCPLAELNLCAERSTHPCHEVVTHQWPDIGAEDRRARWRREHHVPEPWVGHIEHAPLLFLSSNPSLASYRKPVPPRPDEFAPPLPRIGEHQREDHPVFRHGLASPKPDWDDHELIDRFSNAFDIWTVDGTHQVVDETGRAGKRISYWADVRPLAEALFDDPTVLPGSDYALTEVVHCKSQRERGARLAATVCAPLYLQRVLALSPAPLVVVFGKIARNAVRTVFSHPDSGRVSKPLQIAGRNRRFVFLSHPNAKRWPPGRGTCTNESRRA
jgi:hypothetical protein